MPPHGADILLRGKEVAPGRRNRDSDCENRNSSDLDFSTFMLGEFEAEEFFRFRSVKSENGEVRVFELHPRERRISPEYALRRLFPFGLDDHEDVVYVLDGAQIGLYAAFRVEEQSVCSEVFLLRDIVCEDGVEHPGAVFAGEAENFLLRELDERGIGGEGCESRCAVFVFRGSCVAHAGILCHHPQSEEEAHTLAKIVVLDVDGTLMDTNYLHVEAWARAMEAVGHRAVRADLHRQIGKGSDKLIPEFIEDKDTINKVDELHGEIYAEFQPHGHPLPGAKELIASLSERGYQIWLATSAKPEELEQYLEQLETEGKLSGIVNSSDVENSKPAPDIFELALEKAGVSAEEAVALGDAVWDVEAAHGAGIRTGAVLTGGAFDEQELKDSGAVEVYRDCAEVLESTFPE